jgi:hypothetical protein
MTDYDIVDADASHIEAIARHVRQADVNECWNALALPIRDALAISLSGATIARIGRAGGVPIVMYGVTEVDERKGQIWLVATDMLHDHQKGFLRHSRLELADFQARYDRLENHVDMRNKRAVRWLRWLGFEFDDAVRYGPMGKWFYPFWWSKELNQ